MAHTFAPAYQTSILTAGRGPVFFPRFLLALMIVVSLVIVWEGRREPALALPPLPEAGPVLAAMAATGGYLWGIGQAGFLIATIAYTLVLPRALGYRNWPVTLALAAVYPVAVWYVFQEVFRIILPASPWFTAF
jgi:hypothetical protein